jgi:hypothetical protein
VGPPHFKKAHLQKEIMNRSHNNLVTFDPRELTPAEAKEIIGETHTIYPALSRASLDKRAFGDYAAARKGTPREK